jgi:hypothetical protein
MAGPSAHVAPNGDKFKQANTGTQIPVSTDSVRAFHNALGLMQIVRVAIRLGLKDPSCR